MSDAVQLLSAGEHLMLLSRRIDEYRAWLASWIAGAPSAALTPPREVLDGLRQLGQTLLLLKKSVEGGEQERRNLQALAEVGQAVNSSLDLPIVLNQVIDTIILLTSAERAFLMLRNEQGEMDMVVARNWERASLAAGEYEVSRTIIAQVLATGEPVITTNALADPRFGSQDSVIGYSLRSILCAPLKVKGQQTGVIYADNRVREAVFGTREVTLLSAFADQAAVALENARLFDSIRRTLDRVTELNNLMEAIFASIASGVLTADIDGSITHCNRAAEAILPAPQGGLKGASLHELLASLPPDLAGHVERAQREDRSAAGLEYHLDLPERGAADLCFSITPLKSAEDRTTGVTVVVEDLTERRRLEALRRLFERMVSPAVIDQIDPDTVHLGGSRVEITTLFADIRGFTSFGETNSPEILVRVLNHYLAAAADAVLREQGTIDKFLGDAVMAWFNAPIPQPDHPLRAVRSALAIRDAVAGLHQRLPAQFHLQMGIGVHCGEALLGLIGTQKRLEYTAIGDSVNIAKRLQENAVGGQILISREAAARLGDSVEVREVPPIRLEGREQPIPVLEVVRLCAEPMG
jgi:class 3 adenylate cyclase